MQHCPTPLVFWLYLLLPEANFSWPHQWSSPWRTPTPRTCNPKVASSPFFSFKIIPFGQNTKAFLSSCYLVWLWIILFLYESKFRMLCKCCFRWARMSSLCPQVFAASGLTTVKWRNLILQDHFGIELEKFVSDSTGISWILSSSFWQPNTIPPYLANAK